MEFQFLGFVIVVGRVELLSSYRSQSQSKHEMWTGSGISIPKLIITNKRRRFIASHWVTDGDNFHIVGFHFCNFLCLQKLSFQCHDVKYYINSLYC